MLPPEFFLELQFVSHPIASVVPERNLHLSLKDFSKRGCSVKTRGTIIGLLGILADHQAIWRLVPVEEIWSDLVTGVVTAILDFSFTRTHPGNGWVCRSPGTIDDRFSIYSGASRGETNTGEQPEVVGSYLRMAIRTPQLGSFRN
jgi:hypothetical protein